MCNERPAFGERLDDLVELGAIEFRSEPLDDGVERRLSRIAEGGRVERVGDVLDGDSSTATYRILRDG